MEIKVYKIFSALCATFSPDLSCFVHEISDFFALEHVHHVSPSPHHLLHLLLGPLLLGLQPEFLAFFLSSVTERLVVDTPPKQTSSNRQTTRLKKKNLLPREGNTLPESINLSLLGRELKK